jgi:hypothetical protein
MTILIVATAIAVLVALVALAKVNPFPAFLAVSIGMALALGVPPARCSADMLARIVWRRRSSSLTNSQNSSVVSATPNGPKNRRKDSVPSGRSRQQCEGTLVETYRAASCSFAAMTFPDLTPWFDNASDDYEELPAGEAETSYDE